MEFKIENYTDPTRNDNPISGDFVKIIYPNGDYEKKTFWESPVIEIGTEEEETKKYLINDCIYWRNLELQATDYIVPLIDHPKHAAYMAYRQELRDYPAQEDFPNGARPERP